MKFSFAATVFGVLLTIIWASSASVRHTNWQHRYFNQKLKNPGMVLSADSPQTDSIYDPRLRYDWEDDSYLDPTTGTHNGSLYLNTPSNVKTSITYDPDSNTYNIEQKMGEWNYRPPSYMTFEEYLLYDRNKQLSDYWKQRSHAEALNEKKKNALIPKLYINSKAFEGIFGSNTVDIRPNGSAELTFAANISKTDNPSIPIKQRRISTFDFNEKIQLNVIGKIGEKLKLTTNYNTEAAFDYENQMKLQWTGFEDDIIKSIEAGNVNMPLTGTLITGSQSLFGIKTQLQFGKLTVTTVLSQQKGKKSEIEIQGGAQTNSFEVKGDNYESNKHYFLSQYFYDSYDAALANLPVVSSGINITRIEVWVTNTNSSTNDVRDVVAMTDLGESDGDISNTTAVAPNNPDGTSPRNDNNNLNPSSFAPPGQTPVNPLRDINQVSTQLINMGFTQVRDFEKVAAARKLASTEFTFNSKLGFISLNQQLNPDQVLAVAFQYTLNGIVYQVGEFSTDLTSTEPLYVKMLKSSNVSPKTDRKLWELMMKNVYALGAYQVKQEDFKLDVLYYNPGSGTYINVIPESGIPVSGQILIQVEGLDKLNNSLSPSPDGVFDFLDGITINAANGRIYFPTVEPFGDHLRRQIEGVPQNPNNIVIANKYVYDQLYDSTKSSAQQFPDKNRFIIRGSYKSSSGSEISLSAANIPQGSVTVTAGGIPLTENIDYTVDYALGKVKIINEGILQSGTPIKISLESNSLFSIQSKTFMGSRFDYRVNRDFNLGATVVRLSEKPLTQKVNIGDEPIKNTVIGFDGNYRTQAPWLTRAVDKLPLLATKEMSTITTSFEVAKLFPGHAKAIGKDGQSYIDDFEGSQTTIDIKSVGSWTLASTPQGQPSLFPEASQDSTIPGYNRALLAWYVIDPLLIRACGTQGNIPECSYLDPNDQSNLLVKEILESELFPKKQSPNGQPINIPTLDLSYYPSEVGPYNYDALGTTWSAGVDTNGLLKNPASRWGGIMRKIETNDFEAANIEFIQFWMMDPFVRDENGNSTDYVTYFGSAPPSGGELYFNIGNISEDVCKDGRKSFENGLPTPDNPTLPLDTTPWGVVPVVQSIVNAFTTGADAEASRTAQDVGLDGLNDAGEAGFFTDYMADMSTVLSASAYQNLQNDPSHDYYHYFRGEDYDAQQTKILFRYKYYNGMQGNSPVQSGGEYSTTATTIPNTEDINRNNNLNETESYYQYKVKINPTDIDPNNVGNNYITNVFQMSTPGVNGQTKVVNWYQFKIPIKEFLPQDKIGSIEDFKSIGFIRMYVKGFDKPVVIRFAKLELVRGEWRKYAFDLQYPGEYVPVDNAGTSFDVSAVNYEENGTKTPVNYILPPQIEQETDLGTANLIKLNEQAMSLKVCGLKDGDSRAAYKNTDLDVRSYKKLKMYVHAESFPVQDDLEDRELSVFVRLGSDYTDNYYEYEIPLYVTAPGTYSNESEDDKRRVWRIENDMELVFADLQAAKQDRNNKIVAGTATLTGIYEYSITDINGNQRTIRIKGNPNLASIKTIMIGIRNPKRINGSSDDGLSKCAEVWVNELRLAEFDEQGGWAATARISMKLADFGTLSLSGNVSTPGWGSIDKKVSERKKETVLQYDVASQLELGKFFPEKWNIHIPMYVGYSEGRITPQYNPLDPDIELKNIYSSSEIDQSVKDSLKRVTQDFSRRKSINFTNVKKDRPKGSKRNNFYDIENFSFNFSYSEYYNRSYSVAHYLMKDYRGGLTYNYNIQPPNIKPFGKSKSKLMKSKYMTLIRDFNFYPYPSKFTFYTDVDRQYSERLLRNTTGDQYVVIDTTFDKHFNMIRSYDLKFDLSKSLKMDYSADNRSLVREPDGKIDTEPKKNQVKDEFYKGGTTTDYNQSVRLDWTIPISKFPLTDWITASASYGGNYAWDRAAFGTDTMGNTIQNSNQKQLNAQFNMVTLYNKIPYFKKVNQKFTSKNKPGGKDATAPKPDPKDTSKTKKDDQYEILEYIVRTLMLVKNGSISIANNMGSVIPGYLDSTRVMGMDYGTPFGNTYAPGFPFVFGSQKDRNIHQTLAANGLMTRANINNPNLRTNTLNINGRVNIEPLTDFKIEVTGNRNFSRNSSLLFVYSPTFDEFQELNFSEYGNFSMSFLAYKTAFVKMNKDYSSQTFENFLNYRATISTRLHQENPNSTGQLPTGFWQGYGSTSQEVMMFAFLAAYSGSNPDNYSLTTFPKLPKPNWRITYDGLSKLKPLKKYFRTITLSHAYRSSLSYSYTTNLNFVGDGDGKPAATDATGNFIVRDQITSLSLSEQFSPLLKIDVTMNNKITANIEVKKDRNMSLSLSNNQLTEINGKELVIGAGYRIPELELRFSKKKSAKKFKSDLVLKADLSIRNNLTVIRKVVEDVTQPTAGQTVISIKFSADYVLSDKLNVRLFYDQLLTRPAISTSYNSSNINSGVSIRFTLSQ
ncbi:MAG: cell surface protein SprA [Bacteroidota bacterium]